MALPRFDEVSLPPGRADASAMPDTDQWRRRVVPEMERLFAAKPGRPALATAPPAPATGRTVPPVGRPVPPVGRPGAARPKPVLEPPAAARPAAAPEPWRRRSRRDKFPVVPVAAAAVAGIAIGAFGPSLYWRLDQKLHTATVDEHFPLKPTLAPAATQSAQAAPPTLAPKPPELLLQATVEPPPFAVRPVPPPRPAVPVPAAAPPAGAQGPAPPATGMAAQIAEADRALDQAYASARRAGVAAPVLEDDREHWQAVRADAAKRSNVTLLAAYNSRIHDLGGMAEEARSQRSATDAGLRQETSASGRP